MMHGAALCCLCARASLLCLSFAALTCVFVCCALGRFACRLSISANSLGNRGTFQVVGAEWAAKAWDELLQTVSGGAAGQAQHCHALLRHPLEQSCSRAVANDSAAAP